MKSDKALRAASPYNAAVTREQFLFFEMRTTARLLVDGLDKDAVVRRIVSENLFQYPTEKSLRTMSLACIRRLKAMEDETLIAAIAAQPSSVSKQICLYAMMRQYRLVWDFMLTVIGEKYRVLNSSFGRIDVDAFFMRLQEQDDWVATWSVSTIEKLRQVLTKVLLENGYLSNTDPGHLHPVLLCPVLETAIRRAGLEIALPAFNCMW